MLFPGLGCGVRAVVFGTGTVERCCFCLFVLLCLSIVTDSISLGLAGCNMPLQKTAK